MMTPDPQLLQGWLIVLGFLLGIYWLCRQIFLSHFPAQQKEGERYVTHEQFDAFQVKIELQLASFKTEVKKELERAADDLQEKVKTLDTYTRDAFHRQAASLTSVTAGIAWIKGFMGKTNVHPAEQPEDI